MHVGADVESAGEADGVMADVGAGGGVVVAEAVVVEAGVFVFVLSEPAEGSGGLSLAVGSCEILDLPVDAQVG